MCRFVCAIAAMVLGAGTLGMATAARGDEPVAGNAPVRVPHGEPAKASEVDTNKKMDSATPMSAGAPEAMPRVVVHEGASPASTSDGRVRVGAIRISMATWAAPETQQATPPGADVAAKATDTGHAIGVPANTLGPGEPMWRIREREDAQQKLAAAEIDLAQARAEFATRQAGRERPYSFYGGSYFSNGWSGRHDGLRGPVTTTITRSDELGSTAQRAYFDAAYPRLNGTTDARDAIVRQFGRDATPPIVRIQNDVDAIHRRAHSESAK